MAKTAEHSKEIAQTKGRVTVVDAEDYEFLSKWKWYFDEYAKRRSSLSDGNDKVIRMHRLVLPVKDEEQIDHINRDKLDNRKVNLRPCTHAENQRNRPVCKNNTSGYKGVRKHIRGYWESRIKVNGKEIHIGRYSDIKEAARAYNAVAKKHFGEFAYLNKIEGE